MIKGGRFSPISIIFWRFHYYFVGVPYLKKFFSKCVALYVLQCNWREVGCFMLYTNLICIVLSQKVEMLFFLVKNNLACFYYNNYFSCKHFLWKFSFAYTVLPIDILQTFSAFAIVYCIEVIQPFLLSLMLYEEWKSRNS